jgi:hypothetical protein
LKGKDWPLPGVCRVHPDKLYQKALISDCRDNFKKQKLYLMFDQILEKNPLDFSFGTGPPRLLKISHALAPKQQFHTAFLFS